MIISDIWSGIKKKVVYVMNLQYIFNSCRIIEDVLSIVRITPLANQLMKAISFLSIFLAFNLCFGEDTISSYGGTLGAEFPYSELEGNRIAFSEFFGNIHSHFPFLFQSLKEKLSNGDEDIHNINVTEKDIYAALSNTNTPLRSYLYASAAKRKAIIHLNQKKFFTSVFNREVSF